jgi:hypothetical protein
MTLDLGANEVEVKVLTSLVSVTESTERSWSRNTSREIEFDFLWTLRRVKYLLKSRRNTKDENI